MVITGLGAGAISTIRMLFPRVHFTPASTVVVGKPEDYSVGEVSERFKKSHRVVIVREAGGFFALRSVCTHLGCVPDWERSQKKFKCPCHGSGFHRDGVPFEGPAPRPLERLKIFFDEDGQIVVDRAIRLRKERNEWEKEGAFLKYGKRDGNA